MNNKQWFDDFSITIPANSVAQLSKTGRFIRLTELYGGDFVHVRVDSSGWAKMESGMSSPDTVNPFSIVYFDNRSDEEVTVQGWVSFSRGTDDRKKLIGKVEIDDTTPVKVDLETNEDLTKSNPLDVIERWQCSLAKTDVEGTTEMGFDPNQRGLILYVHNGRVDVLIRPYPGTLGQAKIAEIYEGGTYEIKTVEGCVFHGYEWNGKPAKYNVIKLLRK